MNDHVFSTGRVTICTCTYMGTDTSIDHRDKSDIAELKQNILQFPPDVRVFFFYKKKKIIILESDN